MSEKRYAIGIDIGGTNTKIGVVADDGKILARTAFDTEPAEPPADAIDRLTREAKTVVADAGLTQDQFAGIGIGCPGPVSPRRGEVFGPPAHLPTWKRVALCREMSKIGLPAVLDNDANAAAWGEFWAGAGSEVNDMAMLTLGTGVGGGVVCEGRLLHGHFENAAEVGHMIIADGGRPCKCGQRGCLEQYASATYTAERAMEGLREGRASSLGAVLQSKGTVTSQDIVEAVAAGDAFAEAIWDGTCRALAIACVNLQHLFNPAHVVLAGGMAAAGDLLFDRVRAAFDERTWKLMNDRPKIVPGQLGNDAGLVGAAGLLFDSLKN